MTTADSRTIHERMVAILGELPPLGKTEWNEQQKFHFRGFDSMMVALNPLLAKHGVYVLPRTLERIADHRTTTQGKTMYEVNLHVEFTFYGLAGDSVAASGWGEGTDMGDKATSKAMTMAFKYVLNEAFSIANSETVDPDSQQAEATGKQIALASQAEVEAYYNEVEAAGFEVGPARAALEEDAGGTEIPVRVLEKHRKSLKKVSGGS